MKIIVPIDFSKISKNAFDVAMKYALKSENSEVVLLHALEIPYYFTFSNDQVKLSKQIELSLRQFAENKLTEFVEQLNSNGIKAKYKIIENEFRDSLLRAIYLEEADMLIMGSNGKSGKSEWFIGSNTQKVIRKIEKPVMVIKNPLDNLNFKNVVYVSGLNENEKNTFLKFLRFLNQFDVENLHILSVDTTSYFTQPSIVMKEALQDYASLVKGINTEVHFFKDYTIDAGTRHFCSEFQIDLIGICNSFKHPIKRIFQGSNVEIIINHSDIPVMAMA